MSRLHDIKTGRTKKRSIKVPEKKKKQSPGMFDSLPEELQELVR